jgi:5-methylcytosine-specific restriction protein A
MQRWLIVMPMKPKRPCKHPGCPRLRNGRYCDQHAKLHINDRASAVERGYSSRWQKARKRFLAKQPLCVECERTGKLTPSTVVDHIKPYRGDKVLFWNEGNWQSLCRKCHDRKTRTRDQLQSYKF